MTNILDLWVDTAWKTCDMLNFSTQVIAQRTSRMTWSAWMSRYNLEEMHLMGMEKLEAGMEVIQAVAGSMGESAQKISTLTIKSACSIGSDLIQLQGGVISGEANGVQTKIVADSINNVFDHGKELSGSAVRVAADGLEPLYQRTSANARRLVPKPTKNET